MRRRSTFLALAVMTLACCLTTPSRSYAQFYGYFGPGYYGRAGYGFGGPGSFGVGAWGWGGYGYPGYVTNYRRLYYGYTSPGYALQNYSAPASYVEELHITTAGPTGPPTHGTHAQSAHVYVDLPANAQLFFDDTPMDEKGPRRVFRTPPLQPNEKGYTYELTARWTEDGKEHREKRLIHVTPGGTTHVNFLAAQSNPTPVSSSAAGSNDRQ